jgi:hypothetical protein
MRAWRHTAAVTAWTTIPDAARGENSTVRDLMRWLTMCTLFSVGPGALAQDGQVSVGGVYSCVDAKGRKLTSDRPIAECADREQRLLNPSGTVRARVGPTLTAQERAAQDERARQEAQKLALQAEEKRRERALLVRYPNKEAHDRERSDTLTHIGSVIQAANKRIDDLLKERSKLDGEMEFYKKDPSKAPPLLRQQFEDLSQSMASQKRFILEQENEIRRVNLRFDEELLRLKQLWAAQQAAPGTPVRKTP